MRPRVNTEKHYVQFSLFSVAGGAIAELVVAIGQQTRTETNSTHIREGAIISAVWLEIWVTSDDAAQGTTIVTLEKRLTGQAPMTAAQSALLNSYGNKKNVLHCFQGLIGPNVQPAAPSIRGWFKIPKGKQRMGLGDELVINVHGQSNGVSGCGFATFKEQY